MCCTEPFLPDVIAATTSHLTALLLPYNLVLSRLPGREELPSMARVYLTTGAGVSLCRAGVSLCRSGVSLCRSGVSLCRAGVSLCRSLTVFTN